MFEEDDFIDFEISRLISHYIAGTITPIDQYKLDQWLAEPKNTRLLEKILDGTTFRAKIEQYKNEDVDGAFAAFVHKRERLHSKRRQRRWLVAASLLLPLLIATSLWWKWDRIEATLDPKNSIAAVDQPVLILSDNSQIVLSDSNKYVYESGGKQIPMHDDRSIDYSGLPKGDLTNKYNEIQIPAMYTYHLILSDGTKVWLNAQSSLRYPVQFDPDERVVEAVGEIYFEVSPDKNRPFYVKTGDLKVEVTGTAFNVHAYPEESYAQVTLAEGRVRVHAGSERYDLRPGLQLYRDHKSGIARIGRVDVQEYTSWKNGEYIFKSRQLGAVLDVAQRWFGVSFIFKNPSARSTVYTGILLKNR